MMDPSKNDGPKNDGGQKEIQRNHTWNRNLENMIVPSTGACKENLALG